MKRINLILFIILTSSLLVYCSDEVKFENLPDPAVDYLAQHMHDTRILEIAFHEGKYEVDLANGSEFEFNENGKIQSIENDEQGIGANYLPRKINLYLIKNHPQNFVIKWSREDRYQRVRLDNQMVLVFNKNNEFILSLD